MNMCSIYVLYGIRPVSSCEDDVVDNFLSRGVSRIVMCLMSLLQTLDHAPEHPADGFQILHQPVGVLV